MTLEQIKSALPGYAKDLKLNLGSVLTPASLTEEQVWGAALAATIATRNATLIGAIAREAEQKLSAESFEAAKAAAAIMGMNNVYYRFVHLAGGEYGKMPARLRMNVIGNPGVDKREFELWSLAVSAVNGCGMCIKAHEREVLEKGILREGIQDAVRIASVLHAVASVLDTESALKAGELEVAA